MTSLHLFFTSVSEENIFLNIIHSESQMFQVPCLTRLKQNNNQPKRRKSSLSMMLRTIATTTTKKKYSSESQSDLVCVFEVFTVHVYALHIIITLHINMYKDGRFY